MKRTTSGLLGIAFLLCVVSPAGAEFFVVDPDDFGIEEDISNAIPEVTLLTRSGAFSDEVVALDSSASLDPNNKVFGHAVETAGQYADWWQIKRDTCTFEARFSTPADWVSLDFIANDTTDRNAFLKAYDSHGWQIEVVRTPYNVSQPFGEPVTLEITAPGISYVQASWDESPSLDHGELDRLRFEIVPEPSSLVALCSLGLAGGILWYRRKRRGAA